LAVAKLKFEQKSKKEWFSIIISCIK
jgi:hypothetical protein